MEDNKTQSSKINNSEEDFINEKKIEIKLRDTNSSKNNGIRFNDMDDIYNNSKKRPNSNIFRGKNRYRIKPKKISLIIRKV